MDFGSLLGGAGVVARGWRRAEEAEREAWKSELALREQNRLEMLRRDAASQNLGLAIPSDQYDPSTMPKFDPRKVQEPELVVPQTSAPTGVVGAGAGTGAAGVQNAPPQGQPKYPFTLGQNPTPVLDLNTVPELDTQTERDRFALLKGIGATADFVTQPAKGLLNTAYAATYDGVNFLNRGINAIIGDDVFRTDYVSPRWEANDYKDALTSREQRGLAEANSKLRMQLTPTPNLPDTKTLRAAIIQVESGGNPNAVSSKGATGLMQIMPETAIRPGLGIPDIFTLADHMGIPYEAVNKSYSGAFKTKSEAARLLNIPELNIAFGDMYLSALLGRYNNNLEYALAAYNAGPGKIDKWLADGSKLSKLPSETRAYVPKVLSILSGDVPAGGATSTAGAVNRNQPAADGPSQSTAGLDMGGPVSTASTTAGLTISQGQPVKSVYDETAGREIPVIKITKSSRDYVEGLKTTPLELQYAMERRNEVVRLAEMYQRNGFGMEAQQLAMQVREMDRQMMGLQGQQALIELTHNGDPRRFSWIVSRYTGSETNFIPRTDDKFDMVVGNTTMQEGLSADQMIDYGRRLFDPAYRQAVAESETAARQKLFESQLSINEADRKELAQLYREAIVAQQKGQIDAYAAMLDRNTGYAIENVDPATGIVVVHNKDTRQVLQLNPQGEVEVDGETIVGPMTTILHQY